MYEQMLQQVENPRLPRSGFVLLTTPRGAADQSSGLTGAAYLPVPKEISSRNATINSKSKDNQSFKWAVIIAHPERISNLEQYDILNN